MDPIKTIQDVEEQLWALVRDMQHQRHLHRGEPVADFLFYAEATLRREADALEKLLSYVRRR